MSIQTEVSLQKLPPQNVDAEQMVLGAILIENDSINKVVDVLSPEDFYKDSHRRIFQIMLDMHVAREAIDLVTLSDNLRGKTTMEGVGGASYLATLVSLVPTAANIKYHARIVREKSVLRKLIHTSTDIITQCYDDSRTVDSIDELLNTAERSIFDIAQKQIGKPFFSLKEIVGHSIKMVEKLYDQKEMVTGIPTGFVDLDNMMSGLQPSDLIIIAARPSMGKTAFVLNIAAHAAIEKGKTVAFFSLEMAKGQLVLRMLGSEARVDAHKLRTGHLSDRDWTPLSNAAGRLHEAPMYIDDSAAISVLEMQAKARRLKLEHGLDLIIVDYLQLMRGRGSEQSREQEISNISRSLKMLAKDLRSRSLPCLSLMGRRPAGQGKKAHARRSAESGAIEQDADVILFIYRDEVYNNVNALRGECLCGRGVAESSSGSSGTARWGKWISPTSTGSRGSKTRKKDLFKEDGGGIGKDNAQREYSEISPESRLEICNSGDGEALPLIRPHRPVRIGDARQKLNQKPEAVKEYIRAADLYAEKGFVVKALAQASWRSGSIQPASRPRKRWRPSIRIPPLPRTRSNRWSSERSNRQAA
jgi:replicative DNA helicase